MKIPVETWARLVPAIRISLALVLLTGSILLVADLIGVTPDLSQPKLEARQKVSEALAVQFSTFASRRDINRFRMVLAKLVERDEEILSAGFRNDSGSLIFEAGNHRKQWGNYLSKNSTITHVVVPIFNGKSSWGTVEVKFKPIDSGTFGELFNNSVFKLIFFVAGYGFLGYMLIIRKTLRQLDPSAVIPERVNAAFNTLAEGLLILDEKEHIILANTAFAEQIERLPDSLIGFKASELNWRMGSEQPTAMDFPWIRTLQDGESCMGSTLTLEKPVGNPRTLVVNSAPISGSEGKQRGALVTFDDVTELEQKNNQLQEAVTKLEQSQEKVQEQNEELHILATRDSLTGCLNRRSFTEKFEGLFRAARSNESELSCIMIDIDHFKSVNDTYGHARGDEIIKLLADLLHANTREQDLVGRYGGEEFCLILPGLNVEKAMTVAERIRLRIKEDSAKAFAFKTRVTSSLGVSFIVDGADDPNELINQADKALYIAKESGRNRVVKWDRVQTEQREQGNTESNASASTETTVPQDNGLNVVQSSDSVQNRVGDLEVDRLQVRIKNLEHIASKYSKELQYKTSYDALTGLPNQMLFYDRIKQTIARGERYDLIAAVLTLDIDLFSRVNTSLGRPAGDMLLQELSDRLTGIVRKIDGITVLTPEVNDLTISRLGGDEFGILFTDLPDTYAVITVVKRIFESLSQPIDIHDQKIYITCNIGISVYPEDGATPELLLNHSVVARHYAKQMPGQNNYKLFDPQMHQLSLKNMQLESELRRAIDNEEFVLYYQPKLDLDTGEINGVEALIRWNHPDKGLLSPYEFIGVAEQHGLIDEIGEWVIKEACLQSKTWLSMGLKGVRVAVNLSTLQLRQENFTDRIFEILDEIGLAPHYLELEITESLIMDHLDTAVDTLNRLNSRGIWISIDDFGTGHSSLSYLKHLPLNTLKIDRSFMQDILSDGNDKNIVNTIIVMAHSMNLSVTAEGVETQEQLALLRELSCDEVQGYLFSRPVPAEEATELLRAETHPQLQCAG